MANVINKGWRFSTPADAFGNPEDEPANDITAPQTYISLLKAIAVNATGTGPQIPPVVTQGPVDSTMLAAFTDSTGMRIQGVRLGVGLNMAGGVLSVLSIPGNTVLGSMALQDESNVNILGGFIKADTLDIHGPVSFTGRLSVSLVNDVNDWNPNHFGANILAISVTEDHNVTGLTGGMPGRIISLINVGTNGFVKLINESPLSQAENRFKFPTQVNLGPNDSVLLFYDIAYQRWTLFNSVALGAGAVSTSGTVTGNDLAGFTDASGLSIRARTLGEGLEYGPANELRTSIRLGTSNLWTNTNYFTAIPAIVIGSDHIVDGYNLSIHGKDFLGISVADWSNSAAASLIDMYNSRGGTVGVHGAVQHGDDLSAIRFLGSDGTAFQLSAMIYAQVRGTVVPGRVPGRLAFFIQPDAAVGLERKMLLDSHGISLGLGDAEPDEDYALKVHGSGGVDFINSAASIAMSRWDNTSYPANLITQKSRGTSPMVHVRVQNQDFLGNVLFNGSDGTHFMPGAMIGAQVDGVPDIEQMPGRLVFYTAGQNEAPKERMRLDSVGRVAIGRTGTMVEPFRLQIEGHEQYESTASVTLWRADATGPWLQMRHSRAAVFGQFVATQQGDNLGTVSYYGCNNTSFVQALNLATFQRAASPDDGGLVIYTGQGTILARFESSGSFIRGSQTNDAAAAGQIGEYKEITGPPVAMAVHQQVYQLSALSLTAGDWDVEGWVLIQGIIGSEWHGLSVSITDQPLGMPTTAGTYLSLPPQVIDEMPLAVPLSRVRSSLPATGNVYINVRVDTPENIQVTGHLHARRVR
jgi:hypothetical protein